jgi:hypothetical protein
MNVKDKYSQVKLPLWKFELSLEMSLSYGSKFKGPNIIQIGPFLIVGNEEYCT